MGRGNPRARRQYALQRAAHDRGHDEPPGRRQHRSELGRAAARASNPVAPPGDVRLAEDRQSRHARRRAQPDALRRASDGPPADTIYFGGGTPSLLEPIEIRGLIEACRGAFALDPDAEITLEANPETVSAERLDGFRAAGVNRLSYGVQSFRDEELVRLSRLHSAARARDAFALARAAGFDNISLDLMMWLPQQSVADWLESVDALIALGPEHASLYLLEIYPNAPLRDEMARGHWSVAPDEDAAELYLEAMARLEWAC